MERIKKIVSLCDKTEYIADIGTDHGYTIIELIKNNISNYYIASDINIKPLEMSKKNIGQFIEKNNLNEVKDKVFFLLSNGLKEFDKSKKYAFIISGMGFFTIKDILININEYSFDYLIISPQSHIKDFEKFIIEKELFIVNKEIIEDSNKTYFIYKIVNKNNPIIIKKNFLNNSIIPIPSDKILFEKYLKRKNEQLIIILKNLSNENDIIKIKGEIDENKKYLEKLR